jgi:hypothetical protein
LHGDVQADENERMTATVLVEIDAGPDADDADLERLRVQLRDELTELDVESAEPLREGEAPPGTRALDVIAAGALVVKLAPTAISVVVRALQAWVDRDKGRTISIQTAAGDSITLTGATSAERRELMDAWLARQRADAG